jgi:hypothetical protein
MTGEQTQQPNNELQLHGTASVKRGFEAIIDNDGNTVGSISKKEICDEYGEVIAKYDSLVELTNESGNTAKAYVYRSEGVTFKRIEDRVYLNEEYFGKIAKRHWRPLSLVCFLLAIILLLITIIILLCVDIPYSSQPVINVRDNNGSWSGKATVAVFDETIHPGSSGSYDFIVRNEHNVDLVYTFDFAEYLNGQVVEDCPLTYRIKMNNTLITSEEWKPISELNYSDIIIMAQSDQMFTLEWRWLFESGDDEHDTLWGVESGNYNIAVNLYAELYEGTNQAK